MTRTLLTLEDAACHLSEVLGNGPRLLFLTGAGVSTESGIPDFRSPGGRWSRMAPIEYGAFLTDEMARQEDWTRRFEMDAVFAAAEPNACHHAIAEACRASPSHICVTQNVDGLHGRAGMPANALIELHGTAAHAHCLSCGAVASLVAMENALTASGKSPRCTVCGGLMKAAVVSFGEPMPEGPMARAADAAERASHLVVLGTSLAVHPAAGLVPLARAAGAHITIASTRPTPCDGIADVLLRTSIAETFAAVGS
ncbi:MAG: Sir2 family NAD-dependent protein deacetylase [Pseudomonadota bacterium]